MLTEPQKAVMLGFVTEYSEQVWPNLPVPVPTDDDLEWMDFRSDGYANAHVEGEHQAHGLCPYTSPHECGERSAAAEFVECT